jgi:hypothetical protein
MPDRVSQSLKSMLDTLDEIAAKARDPAMRAEIAAQEVRLGQIISRAQLILSFLDTYKSPARAWIETSKRTSRGKNG